MFIGSGFITDSQNVSQKNACADWERRRSLRKRISQTSVFDLEKNPPTPKKVTADTTPNATHHLQ